MIIILALRFKPRTVLCLSVVAPLAWRLFSTWWRMWCDELVIQQKREANKVLFLFCIILIHLSVAAAQPDPLAPSCTQELLRWPRLKDYSLLLSALKHPVYSSKVTNKQGTQAAKRHSTLQLFFWFIYLVSNSDPQTRFDPLLKSMSSISSLCTFSCHCKAESWMCSPLLKFVCFSTF